MALNLKAETVLTGEPAAAQPPLPPEQIAPHFPQLEILECLGRGGMGVVYKARQKTLNRFVALKLLAPERVREAKFAERFTREAQALAALNHPNIVTIYDFGQAGGFYFLLMEFVDGVNLRQLLRARKFTPEEALAVVPPLCDALQYAHDRGIVHRDIKPENLLLDKDGRVKVADFGIAKMIEPEGGRADLPVSPEIGAAQQHGPTGVVGTPSYSAPEQQTDPHRVDSRADIYSLGVVFYEMLTGELPGKRLEPPSRKVQIDVRLDEVVLRALERNPDLRYQQASEVKTMVETIAVTAPIKKSAIRNPQSEESRLAFVKTPFVIVREGKPRTNWPAVIVTGALMALLMPGGMIIAAAVGIPDALVKRVLLLVVLPGVSLIPLWLFLEVRAGHRALEQGLQPLPLFAKRKNWLHRWVGRLLAAVFIAFFIRTFLATPYRVPTDAAAPEIPRGSHFFVWRPAHHFAPGDFMAYWHDGEAYIGRVVRVEGEAVSVNRNGKGDALVPRGEIIGKVISVYWRASASAQTTPGFYIAQTYFPKGDSIEITSVSRSSDRMVVQGHYNLVSQDQATLALYITATNRATNPGFPEDATQRKQISKGRGDFELIHSNLFPGLPHLAMYAGGKNFADLYFGTQAEAAEEGKLNLQAYLSFGPVMERVVADSKTDFASEAERTNALIMIDFDSGALLAPTSAMWAADTNSQRIWMQTNGVDAMAVIPQVQGLVGLDMKSISVPAQAWDELPADSVVKQLSQTNKNDTTLLSPGKSLPPTWLFQTRKGGAGILQITGLAENPPGVKIRYKLVENIGGKN
jgi:tRNA A-37 threonylcarbamoyl transferase component Bud32/signal peptidase I